MARLLGVDWGTTRLRVRDLERLDDDQAEVRSSDLGLLKAKEVGFKEALTQTAGDMLGPDTTVIMSGMVGAREGWRQAPYCDVPCKLEALAAEAVKVDDVGREAWILPGARCNDGSWPDVMRGEETELWGCVELGCPDGVYLLPGTHSKWARIDKGQLVSFRTYVTGDLYQAVMTNTILRKQMDSKADWDRAALGKGVELGGGQEGAGEVLAQLFSGRTLELSGELASEQVPSYVLGILLGAEIRSGRQDCAGKALTVIGSHAWIERYQHACSVLGQDADAGPPHAAFHGQLAAARLLIA